MIGGNPCLMQPSINDVADACFMLGFKRAEDDWAKRYDELERVALDMFRQIERSRALEMASDDDVVERYREMLSDLGAMGKE